MCNIAAAGENAFLHQHRTLLVLKSLRWRRRSSVMRSFSVEVINFPPQIYTVDRQSKESTREEKIDLIVVSLEMDWKIFSFASHTSTRTTHKHDRTDVSSHFDKNSAMQRAESLPITQSSYQTDYSTSDDFYCNPLMKWKIWTFFHPRLNLLDISFVLIIIIVIQHHVYAQHKHSNNVSS